MGYVMPDYLEPYHDAMKRFGPSFETTLWRNRSFQVKRFEVFGDMVDPAGRRLLDAGCGLGDLYDYLEHAGSAPSLYVGLDALSGMVEEAARRHEGCEGVEFRTVDFVADRDSMRDCGPDIIFISGALNTVPEEIAREVLVEVFDACDQALVFNFLSDRCSAESAGRDTAPATRFDTVGLLDWALRVTPGVCFRQDYLGGHDATIGMFK